ncbi:unnamed protein product, partial [Prorocentrum cordatum]
LPSRRGWGRASSRLTAWPWTGPGVFREADHRAWAARPREGEEGARGTVGGEGEEEGEEGGESTMGGGRKGMTTPQVIASSWEPGQTIIRGLAGRQTSCAKVNTAPSVRLTSLGNELTTCMRICLQRDAATNSMPPRQRQARQKRPGKIQGEELEMTVDSSSTRRHLEYRRYASKFTRLTHSLLAPKIPRPCWRTNAPVSGLLTCKAINLERRTCSVRVERDTRPTPTSLIARMETDEHMENTSGTKLSLP